jgi:hypothetical protein
MFDYYNYYTADSLKNTGESFIRDNLPVVYDSYYHTIHSDGKKILVLLKNNGEYGVL